MIFCSNSVEENATTGEEVSQMYSESQTTHALVPAKRATKNVDHSEVAAAGKSAHICSPLTGKGHATVRQALACRQRAKTNEIEVNHANIESQTADAIVQAEQSTENIANSEVQVSAISYHICDPLTVKGHATVGQALACRRSTRKRYISAKIDLDELSMHYNMTSLYGTRTDSDRRRPKDPCPCGVQEETMVDGMATGDKRTEPLVDHSNEGPFTCAICGKVFPEWHRLKRHMSTHPAGDEHFQCDVCGRSFALMNHLSRHLKVHTTHRPFVCGHCGASFAEKGFLDMHMTAHQPKTDKEAAIVMAAANTQQEMYRCRKCSEAFSKKWRLRRHMTENHRTRPALKTRPSSRCVCPICGKSLAYRLSIHMRQHTGERPYKCATCGKSFYQRSSFSQHLSTHTGVKSHTCAECGKSFRLHSLLRQHMRKHSDGSNWRHVCAVCGKRFWVPMLLRDHMLLHTGERPFQCAACGRRFRLRKELVKHERFHSGELHMVRCDVCGLEVNDLKRHRQTHTGEKPHGCERCGKVFRRKEHLRIHCSRVHNVELPRRQKVQAASLDKCLLTEQNDGMEPVNADDCGLTLVVGDSVVV